MSSSTTTSGRSRLAASKKRLIASRDVASARGLTQADRGRDQPRHDVRMRGAAHDVGE